MKTIAIVDDDRFFLAAIVAYFQGRGFRAQGFSSYHEAQQGITTSIDLIIIDIVLPDGDGINLLTQLKTEYPQVKTIIITGKDTLPRRLRSFGLGTDDYMMKPIFPAELEARVKRLCKEEQSQPHVAGQLHDPKRFTKSELAILAMLSKANGAPVTIEALASGTTKSAVYTTISRLKVKLCNEYEIRSAYGRGYYLQHIK